MFAGFESLAHRQLDVGDGGIVVQFVKVLFRPLPDGVLAGQNPQRPHGALARLRRLELRRFRRLAVETGGGSGGAPGLVPLGKAFGQRLRAVTGADASARIGGRAPCRHETMPLGGKFEAALGLTEQVHRGRPAAGNRDEVATQVAGRAVHRIAVRGKFPDLRPPDLPTGVIDRADAAVGVDADGLRLRLLNEFSARRLSHIHDLHLGADSLGVERGVVGAVVVGQHDDAFSRQHAEAVDVGAHRTGQHHPRPIVVGKHQRTLDAAGRQHHPFRANLPQALLGRPLALVGAEMLAHALVRHQKIVVVVAGYRGSQEQRYLLHPAQVGNALGDPLLAGRPADFGGAGEQTAAELVPLIRQQHPRPGGSGCPSRLQPARPAAHHQNIAVRVSLVVAIRIGFGGGSPKPGGSADGSFVGHPQESRPFECLVIETGGEEAPQPGVDRAEIEGDRRPAVLTAGDQAVVQLDLRGAPVGFGVGAAFQLHQRIGLLGTGGEDSPGAVVLEAAADQHDAVGQQRRRQRVAGVSLVLLVVVPESDDSGAVDAAALGQTVDLPHGCVSSSSATSAISGMGSPGL